MTDWFRSWHGAPTDPKWLAVARRAGVAPGIAVAVVWALMDRASQSSERGSIAGYDAEALAYFYGCEPEQVDGIVVALREKGMLSGDRFTAWEKRQPKREDDSSQRVREHRERTATQAQAVETPAKRNVTQRNAPDTDTDTDTESKIPPSLRSGGARARRLAPDEPLPDAFREDASEIGLPADRHEPEWRKMRDWSLSARDGAKRDWRAAWRNWCRRAVSEAPPRSGAGPPVRRPPSQADVFAMIAKRLADEPQRNDSAGPRPAIPHLSAIGSGR